MRVIDHFINGEHFRGQNKNTVDVFNPASGEITAHVALASAQETEIAITAATEALNSVRLRDTTITEGRLYRASWYRY